MNKDNEIRQRLREQLEEPPVTYWKPEPGHDVMGEVVELGTDEGKFGAYPTLTVHTDDDGDVIVRCEHTVLRNQLERKKPRPGDWVGVKYVGEVEGRERTYKDYRLAVVHQDEPPVDEEDRDYDPATEDPWEESA